VNYPSTHYFGLDPDSKKDTLFLKIVISILIVSLCFLKHFFFHVSAIHMGKTYMLNIWTANLIYF